METVVVLGHVPRQSPSGVFCGHETVGFMIQAHCWGFEQTTVAGLSTYDLLLLQTDFQSQSSPSSLSFFLGAFTAHFTVPASPVAFAL